MVTTGSGGNPYTSGSSRSRKNAPAPPIPSLGSSPYRRASVTPGSVQLLDTVLRANPQLIEVPELDRLRRARLGTRRGHPLTEPVIAQRAFLGDADIGRGARTFAPLDHAERTRRDAVSAPVAHVVLNDDGSELGAHERPGRADVEACRMRAVLAHIGRHQPADSRLAPVVLARAGSNHRERGESGCAHVAPGLLDEGDVAPRARAQRAGVVVRHAEHLQTVLGNAVPFLASHLARLAADADGAVREETFARRSLRPPCVGGGITSGRPSMHHGLVLRWRDPGRSGADSEPRTTTVPVDVAQQCRPGRTPPGLDVAGCCLRLLDVHVRIERDSHDVVCRVAAHRRSATTHAPVIGKPDLVDHAAPYLERRHPMGDEHPRLDGGASRGDRRPAPVLQPALGGKLGRDLTEELRLQFREVGQPPAHATRRVMLGEPVGGGDKREDVRPRLRRRWAGGFSRRGYISRVGFAC